MITKEKLEELGACRAGLYMFDKRFPKGRVSNQRLFKLLDKADYDTIDLYREYITWLALHYQDFTCDELITIFTITDTAWEFAGTAAKKPDGLTFIERKRLLRLSMFWERDTISAAVEIRCLSFRQRLQLVNNLPVDRRKDAVWALITKCTWITVSQKYKLKELYLD